MIRKIAIGFAIWFAASVPFGVAVGKTIKAMSGEPNE